MARWHSCNVFQPGHEFRNLWQFAVGGKFNLQRQETKLPTEALPEKLIGKDWQTLFQPRLNVAWLPAEKVFLRVVQLPKADYAETQSMLELQLEKLSPLPVTQVVWGFELIPSPWPDTQTAVLIIVSRAYVEEFLNVLEGQGFLADRLELPFLDLLRATTVHEDGAWIYTGSAGSGKSSCLVAWWYGGSLQNLSLLHLPADAERGAFLQAQLAQMTWAGEFEGWLTSPPKYHLVAPAGLLQVWKAYFREDQPVELASPLPPEELAKLTAKRAVQEDVRTNLLPPEYSARYKQQFIDRLWMRGLGAVVMIYVVLVAAYLGWVQFAKWQYTRIEKEVVRMGPSYTNALQLKERVRIMQEQRDLQFAALDCWKAVADFLPSELTLRQLSFDRGRTLTLMGSAGSSDQNKVYDFNESMRKFMVKDQPFFSKVVAPPMNPLPGGQQISWSFVCDLKRTGTDKE